MEIFSFFLTPFDFFFAKIVPFLFVLTIVVFFHELGHFSVARFFKTRIDAFSIGYGKEIFGWTDRVGTRWRVSWLPLGGYVKFFGDENMASAPDRGALENMESALSEQEKSECFHFKPLHERAAIVAAGPFANFILAIAIFAVMFMTRGELLIPAKIGVVVPESAAEEAGFLPGDIITKIDDKSINEFLDLQLIVSVSPETPMTALVDRGGREIALDFVPRLSIVEHPLGGTQTVGRMGIQPDENAIEVVKYGPLTAVAKGTERTWFIIDQTFAFLGRLVVGKGDASELGGPLSIANISAKTAEHGIVQLVLLAGFLSVSIGLINLFPIPLLDGGHLLFYGIEAVKGSPLSENTQEFGFRVGLALVLCLMIFATWNDVVRMM